MSEAAVQVDPALLQDAFEASLNQDAQRGQLAAEPPPRPHWLNEDGSPKYGTKPDGTPKKGPGGPGRGKQGKPAAPRGDTKAGDVASPDAGTGSPAPQRDPVPATARDYAADVDGLLFLGWMGCASTPWTKAQAAVISNARPQLAPAWGKAAENNATVRGWVNKFAGEGSFAWVIPVAMTTTTFGIALWESLTNRELRAQLVAQTDSDWTAFLIETAKANGIEIPAADPDHDQETHEDPYEQTPRTPAMVGPMAGMPPAAPDVDL